MKKIIVLTLIILLFVIGIYVFANKEKNNEIPEKKQIQNIEEVVNQIETTYYSTGQQIEGIPTLEQVIENFNKLNYKATIIDNKLLIEDKEKATIECDIIYNDCNFKIKCLDNITKDMYRGDC